MFHFCIFPLQKGEADAISLDGGFVYTAGMCGLVPVVAESYEGKHSSVSGSRGGEWAGAKVPVLFWNLTKQLQCCILQKSQNILGWKGPNRIISPTHGPAQTFQQSQSVPEGIV